MRVIFAVDGDTAETITDMLLGLAGPLPVYAVLHNSYKPCPADVPVELTMCLPARRPGGEKCLPVVRVKLTPEEANAFLFSARPLYADNLAKRACPQFLRHTFQPLLAVLRCGCKQSSNMPCSDNFRGHVYWHRAKFIAALRKLFRVSPSPHWLITTCGQFEMSFVLVSTFYFFEDHSCTVETLQHLASLYDSAKGQSLATINSFAEVSALFGTSSWLPRVPDFTRYVRTKLDRDDFESDCVDQAVDEFRGRLMLSNHDLVHYIYLSFFQCFNKNNFLHYSHSTASRCAIEKAPGKPLLAGGIDANFRSQMATYYTKSTYLDQHVRVCAISCPTFPGYDFNVKTTEFWAGLASDVQDVVAEARHNCPGIGVPENLQGLLDLAASEANELPLSGQRMPVYRCEHMRRNYFVLIAADDIEAQWQRAIPDFNTVSHENAHALTQSIHYRGYQFSAHSLREQLSLSRHEYFNPRLPVFNWILDFDLPLQGNGTYTFDELHALCQVLRADILEVLQRLGDIAVDHPVYFFKSACPELPWELACQREHAFCRCSEKLGMRIITPFPEGVCLVGSRALVALTNVLNRLTKLNHEATTLYPALKDIDQPFDTGIYHKGRCVRLPHTYKVGASGELTRQLRLFVCHPGDKRDYVCKALRLSTVLHHAAPSNPAPKTNLIYDVIDLNEDFLAKKTCEQLPRGHANVVERIESLSGTDILDWINKGAWRNILDSVCAYMPDDRAGQLCRASLSRGNNNIIRVCPHAGRNFKCLSHAHRNKSPNARVYLTLYLSPEDRVTVTLMSQCFANKCNNNAPVAHVSTTVSVLMADEHL